MKQVILFFLISNTLVYQGQTKKEIIDNICKNEFNYLILLNYMPEGGSTHFSVDSISNYSIKTYEDNQKALIVNIYKDNTYNYMPSYLSLDESKINDTIREFNKVYHNNKLYLLNNNCLNYKNCNVDNDYVMTYDEVGKIIKMENYNFHLVNNKFLIKNSIEFEYSKNEIVKVVATASLGKGTKNVVDPKIINKTVYFDLQFIDKTRSKISYTKKSRSVFPYEFGKIYLNEVASVSYEKNKTTRILGDSAKTNEGIDIWEYNGDTTLKLHTYINKNFLENIFFKQISNYYYDNKKNLINQEDKEFKNDELTQTVNIDFVLKTTKTYNAKGSMIKETRADNKVRWIDSNTGQWTDWQFSGYCPIK
jgi:hypothetical protein